MRVPGPDGAVAVQLLPKMSPTMEVGLEMSADLEVGAAADGWWVHEVLLGAHEEEGEGEKEEEVVFWWGSF